MTFKNMRIKQVNSVIHYKPNVKKWSAKNRSNHFVGIMLDGSAYHNFGYQDFVLSRNKVYFFNQKDDYEVEAYEAGDSFSVHFTTYEDIETESFCVSIENPEEFVTLLKKAELLKNDSEKGELALLSTLYKLLDTISQVRHKAYFPRDARISAAKSYMDTNFRNDDCLAGAVAQSGISARRFNDLFKGNFGTPPNRYIILKRIAYAKSLLETRSLTITEVAAHCGFSNVYYFSKVFKQICGISPSKWM